jgi:isopropylmalate/homocitrate/citramalate synthase
VVQHVVEQYVEHGADVIVLADTWGHGTPEQVAEIVSNALKVVPAHMLGLHMHDTMGRARENCAAGADLGVRRFDSATGGCGGCNFVPDAQGNVSTQAVLGVLEGLGIEHGMDWGALDAAHCCLQGTLGRELDASV